MPVSNKSNKNLQDSNITHTSNINSDQLKQENEKLKNEMNELKNQLAMLSQMIMQNNTKTEIKKSNKLIRFINLTNSVLVLKGTNNYALKNQFDYRDFLESEARIIVNNTPNAIHSGLCYIADSNFVEDCNLNDVYNSLLTEDQLKTLLIQNAEYVIDIYKNAPEGQKSIIISMIENKQLNGQKIDANILLELGNLSGKNLIGITPIEKGE